MWIINRLDESIPFSYYSFFIKRILEEFSIESISPSVDDFSQILAKYTPLLLPRSFTTFSSNDIPIILSPNCNQYKAALEIQIDRLNTIIDKLTIIAKDDVYNLIYVGDIAHIVKELDNYEAIWPLFLNLWKFACSKDKQGHDGCSIPSFVSVISAFLIKESSIFCKLSAYLHDVYEIDESVWSYSEVYEYMFLMYTVHNGVLLD